MAEGEEMALTGQPEALQVGMWESNRKGRKKQTEIFTWLLAEQTWLLPPFPAIPATFLSWEEANPAQWDHSLLFEGGRNNATTTPN